MALSASICALAPTAARSGESHGLVLLRAVCGAQPLGGRASPSRPGIPVGMRSAGMQDQNAHILVGAVGSRHDTETRGGAQPS